MFTITGYRKQFSFFSYKLKREKEKYRTGNNYNLAVLASSLFPQQIAHANLIE